METNGLAMMEPDIDLSQVPAIHQKRTLAFINHFIVQTVNFLNKFSSTCEMQFLEYERKLQKVEASLLILETKLSSIPGLDESVPKNDSNDISVVENKTENAIVPIDLPVLSAVVENVVKNEDEEVVVNITSSSEPINGVKACEDIRYMRFFKMLQFGVPLPAVKLKMASEGYDAAILDTPQKILEDGKSKEDELNNSSSCSTDS